MRAPNAWWINDLERLRKEQNGSQEREQLQIPVYDYPTEPPKEEPVERRGVVIIDMV